MKIVLFILFTIYQQLAKKIKKSSFFILCKYIYKTSYFTALTSLFYASIFAFMKILLSILQFKVAKVNRP